MTVTVTRPTTATMMRAADLPMTKASIKNDWEEHFGVSIAMDNLVKRYLLTLP